MARENRFHISRQAESQRSLEAEIKDLHGLFLRFLKISPLGG